MAYIGREPQVGNFQVCDAISVVNGQAAYTMQVSSVNVSPETANHMLVSLNGVLQAPGSSYTVSGSTITFASNLVTGDVIDFIHILGSVLDLGTPSDDTVATSSLKANSVTGAKLNTDVISAQTALTSSPADTDELLVSDAGVLKRVDVSLVGGKNTPAFQAYLGSNQNCANATYVKINFNTEVFDSDNTYDNSSNYRFTPGVAGKYFIYAQLRVGTTTDYNESYLQIRKNGTALSLHSNTNFQYDTIETYGIFDSDADDYFEIFYYNNKGGSNVTVYGDTNADYETHFGAFKIIGA